MVSDCQPHGLQDVRLPCPSPTPKACSNSRSSRQWCHPTISSSVVPFSSCLQSFPASGSFPMSQFFVSGNQSIGASASASVLPMNIQDWFPLGWTDFTSLQSNAFSKSSPTPQLKNINQYHNQSTPQSKASINQKTNKKNDVLLTVPWLKWTVTQ